MLRAGIETFVSMKSHTSSILPKIFNSLVDNIILFYLILLLEPMNKMVRFIENIILFHLIL
jgi:hypothetical protein